MAKKFKFVVALLTMAIFGVCGNAQTITKVSSFERVGNGSFYNALAGNSSLQLPSWQYAEMKNEAYLIQEEDGFQCVAYQVTRTFYKVQDAALSGDESTATIHFTNGEAFSSRDLEWLRAQPGQTVVMTAYAGYFMLDGKQKTIKALNYQAVKDSELANFRELSIADHRSKVTAAATAAVKGTIALTPKGEELMKHRPVIREAIQDAEAVKSGKATIRIVDGVYTPSK